MSTETLRQPAARLPARERNLRWLGYLLACVSPLLTLWAINHFGVDVPYYDDWDFTGAALDRWLQGKLTLGFFFSQHMEHRVLLPRLILFGIAVITHWHTTAGMYANWLVAVIVLVLIVRLLIKGGSGHSATALFAIALISSLVFGLMQWEIWLWSPGMQIVLMALLLVVSISIAKSSWKLTTRVIACAMLALLATYSSGNGFLLWVLLPPVLLLEGWSRDRNRLLLGAMWIGCAVAGIGLYFVHYASPQVDTAGMRGSPLEMLAFLLRYLGSALGSGANSPETLSLWIGLLLLCLWTSAVVYAISRKDFDFARVCMPWFFLGAYSIFTGAMIAVARAGGGASIAISSRYIGYSIYLPVSLVCLSLIVFPRTMSRRLRHAPVLVMSAFLVLQIMTTIGALNWLELAQAVRAQARCTLRYLDLLPDAHIFAALSQHPEFIRECAPRLDRAGYLHPSLDQTHVVSGLSITQESLAGESTIARDGDMFKSLIGLLPVPSDDPIGAIALSYPQADGREVIVAISMGRTRTDTFKALATLTSPVWPVEFPVSRLPPGQTRIRFWAVHANSFRFTRLDTTAMVER